jgi:hypothetical protein
LDHFFVFLNSTAYTDPKYSKDFFPPDNYPDSVKLVNKLVTFYVGFINTVLKKESLLAEQSNKISTSISNLSLEK